MLLLQRNAYRIPFKWRHVFTKPTLKLRLKRIYESQKHQKSNMNAYNTVLRLFKDVFLRLTTVCVCTRFIHIILRLTHPTLLTNHPNIVKKSYTVLLRK